MRLLSTIAFSCLLFLQGCAPSIQVIVAPSLSVDVPTPNKLKLVEGLLAEYDQGSLFMDTLYLENSLTAKEYLQAVYGNEAPQNESLTHQRMTAQQSFIETQQFTQGSIIGYVGQHKDGHQLAVFGYDDGDFVVFLTGKGYSLEHVLKSIREI